MKRKHANNSPDAKTQFSSLGPELVGPHLSRLSIFLFDTHAWKNVTMERTHLLSMFLVHAGGTDNGNVMPTQQTYSMASKPTTCPAFRTGRNLSQLSIFLVHTDAGDNVNMMITQQSHLTEPKPSTVRKVRPDLNLSRLSIFLVHTDAGDNVNMKRTQQFRLAESMPATLATVESKTLLKYGPSKPGKEN